MNEDKNDIALQDAPTSVDGKKVLSVLQVSISDIPSEDSYKVLLADATQVSVPMTDFTPGSAVTVEDTPVEQPQEQATEPVAPVVAPENPIYQPETPAQPEQGVTL